MSTTVRAKQVSSLVVGFSLRQMISSLPPRLFPPPTAGPAKTPEGYASGSFGPTTAGRMDSYVASFMQNGGSFITLAKGNRSRQVQQTARRPCGDPVASLEEQHSPPLAGSLSR